MRGIPSHSLGALHSSTEGPEEDPQPLDFDVDPAVSETSPDIGVSVGQLPWELIRCRCVVVFGPFHFFAMPAAVLRRSLAFL